MEHIEEAGVHSGDAAMVLPAHTLPHWMLEEIRRYTHAPRRASCDVVGLMNVQYAVQGKELYIIEVNPRASRTVPFVSKAIGVPLAKIAAKVMVGMTPAGDRLHGGGDPAPHLREGIRASRSRASPGWTSSWGPR